MLELNPINDQPLRNSPASKSGNPEPGSEHFGGSHADKQVKTTNGNMASAV